MIPIKKIILFLSIIFITSSCDKRISYKYPDNQDYARNMRSGRAFSEKDLVVFGDGAPKNSDIKDLQEIKKSAIWRSTVEVVGSTLEIDSMDPSLGMVNSKWQITDNGGKRIRIIAFISGLEAKKENISITIFRQIKSGNDWLEDSIENSQNQKGSDSLAAKLIQEKIIQKSLIK